MFFSGPSQRNSNNAARKSNIYWTPPFQTPTAVCLKMRGVWGGRGMSVLSCMAQPPAIITCSQLKSWAVKKLQAAAASPSLVRELTGPSISMALGTHDAPLQVFSFLHKPWWQASRPKVGKVEKDLCGIHVENSADWIPSKLVHSGSQKTLLNTGRGEARQLLWGKEKGTPGWKASLSALFICQRFLLQWILPWL